MSLPSKIRLSSPEPREVYWLQQTETDVPAHADWLSTREAECLGRMRFAKRRSDWRLGRWTSKVAIATYLRMPLDPETMATIELRPCPTGAPEVFLADRLAALNLSLSHRDGVSISVVTSLATAVGCDLERIEPRSPAFADDYFTAEEHDLVMRSVPADRPRLLTLLWSAKESVLKAMRTGLRLDTRSLAVSFPKAANVDLMPRTFGAWLPLLVHANEGEVFRGWWQQSTPYITTVAAASPFAPPIPL